MFKGEAKTWAIMFATPWVLGLLAIAAVFVGSATCTIPVSLINDMSTSISSVVLATDIPEARRTAVVANLPAAGMQRVELPCRDAALRVTYVSGGRQYACEEEYITGGLSFTVHLRGNAGCQVTIE